MVKRRGGMLSPRLQSTNGSNSSTLPRALRHGNGNHDSLDLTQPSSSHLSQPNVSTLNFLDLPDECVEKILGYVSYKQVSQLRLVCKRMDNVCGKILNSTFRKLLKQMFLRLQTLKAKMPRRESARRNHPLTYESDIIETVHSRLSLVHMTLARHIDHKHICFFPGEILDEVYRILRYIKGAHKLARSHTVTEELFDLSDMAMEYFKDRIEPTLPEITCFIPDFLSFTSLDSCLQGIRESEENSRTTQSDDHGVQPQSDVVLRKHIRKMKLGMKKYSYQLGQMRKELRCCRGKITLQQKQILEYASRLDDYGKKTEETDRKFSTMLQELNKCKTELQYLRSKSPLTSVCGGCGAAVGPLSDQLAKEVSINHGGLVAEVEPEPRISCALCPSDILTGQHTPKQRNKRKSSTEKSTPASVGPPSAKKSNTSKPQTKRE